LLDDAVPERHARRQMAMGRGPGARWTVTGAAVLAVALMAGCTGAGDSETSADQVSTTTEAAADAMSVEEFLALLRTPGEQVLGSHEATVEVAHVDDPDFGTMTERTTVLADFRGESPLVEATMEMDDGSDYPGMGIVVLEDATFTSEPMPDGEVVWVELAAEEAGVFAQDMLTEGSPLLFVETIWELWDDDGVGVELVGAELLGGATMEHYVVAMEDPVSTQGWTASSMPVAASYDVWLDDEGLMRRVEAEPDGAHLTATVDRWGETVEISAPDPATVVSSEELESMYMDDGPYGDPATVPLEIMAYDEQLGVCSVSVGRVEVGTHPVFVMAEDPETVVELVDAAGDVVFTQVGDPFVEDPMAAQEPTVDLEAGDYTVVCTYSGGFVGEDHLSVTDGE
jgi:hypothetical protein